MREPEKFSHVVRVPLVWQRVPHTKNYRKPGQASASLSKHQAAGPQVKPPKLLALPAAQQLTSIPPSQLPRDSQWVVLFATRERAVAPSSVSSRLPEMNAFRHRIRKSLRLPRCSRFLTMCVHNSGQHAPEQGPGQVPHPRLCRASRLRPRYREGHHPRPWSVQPPRNEELDNRRERDWGSTGSKV